MKFLKKHLWIDDQFRILFKKNDFDSFKRIYNCDRGKLVRGEMDKSIKYFSLKYDAFQSSFYLKKQHTTILAHLKRLLRRWHILKLQTSHEFELIKFYQACNISVVRVVAWGEERWLGFPVRGFIIQEEVKGTDFIDVIKDASKRKRIKLVKAYGQMVGQLHSKGLISSVVRVTDIVCVSSESRDWKNYEYVLIDREKGPLVAEKVDIDSVSRILAFIFVRFVLYIGSPSLKETIGFLKAYSSIMSPSYPMDWKELFFRSEKYFIPLMQSFDEKI